MLKITVIIATSNSRTDLLFNRALKSVYNQTYSKNVNVIIVDDNKDETQYNIIKDKLKILRKSINIRKKFPTNIIKNNRTKFHSGTGAWNSAAFSCIDLKKLDSIYYHYLAFLDDDDEWENSYLEKCINAINTNDKGIIGLVACGINFINNNDIKKLYPNKETITKENIFIKNPHIQGSNLFVNLWIFLSIGCFDESMKSTTDRDLIMRYVEFVECNKNIKTLFINETLVNYFYDNQINRVTTNKDNKFQGLNLFYRKYSHLFNEKIKLKSLKRAKELFGYTQYNNKDKTPIRLNSKTNENIYNISKINLILGFICFDCQNLKDILFSFSKNILKDSSYLKDFSICIITSFESQKYYKNFNNIINEYDFDIKVKWLKNKYSISKNRTYLQRFIYKEGIKRYRNNFVSWVVDDDSRFYGIYKNKHYEINYLYYISKYSNLDIDAFVCGNCGEPPLPFFSMIRTQLLDLYFKIKIGNKTNDICDYLSTYKQEYYYDISSKNFDFLEYPFFNLDITIKDFINNLKNGHSSTRNIEANINLIGEVGNDTLYRGGNTIIYNLELLKIENFTPDNSKYNRRSDFNWAIVNSILLNRKIKELDLPITHIRNSNIDLKKEYEKMKADLIGLIFYRLFKYICKEIKFNKKPSFLICKKYLSILLDDLKKKLFVNTLRIRTLNEEIKTILNNKHYKQYYKEYLEFEKNLNCILNLFETFCADNLCLKKSIYNKVIEYIFKELENI